MADFGETFDPSMLHLVDQVGNCYLLRGNMPQVDGKLCYDTLITSITKLIPSPPPKNIKLIDLCLLNEKHEADAIELEKSFFRRNPDKGYFTLTSLHGNFLSPFDIPSIIRNQAIKLSSIDDLKELVPKIWQLLHTVNSYDLFLYVHCNEGKDRTGEAIASYLMQYKGYSYKDVVDFATKIAGRKLGVREGYSIQWYAFYLRDTLKITTIGEITK